MRVFVIALAAIFFSGLSAEAGSTVTCSHNDVLYAQIYYDGIQRLVDERAEGGISLFRAAMVLAQTQYCAGERTVKSFCSVVNINLAKLRDSIDALRAQIPNAIGGIDSYLNEKFYYSRLCDED